MIGIFSSTRDYCVNTWRGWNRFWFTPADPATLSLLRLLAGGVLFYTHLIWSFDLSAFLGTAGWLPAEMLRSDLHGGEWSAWSVFFWIEPTWLLWCVHLLALAVFFCLMIGLMSRTVAVLAPFVCGQLRPANQPRGIFRLGQNQPHAGDVPDARPLRGPGIRSTGCSGCGGAIRRLLSPQRRRTWRSGSFRSTSASSICLPAWKNSAAKIGKPARPSGGQRPTWNISGST